MPAASRARPSRRSGALGTVGPSFVTAALVFGPGSITTASSLGAELSYDLVWVPVVATVLMLCFVDLSVRIGLSSNTGPVGVVSRLLGRGVGVLVALGAFVVATSFQAGNSVGAGAAVGILWGGSTPLLAVIFTALAVGLLWLPSFYRQLERTMVVLIGLMVAVFVVTAVVARPDPVALAAGLVPSLPPGSTALVVGSAATTFSVVGAFYQIQLVREKGWGPDDYAHARRDAVIGTLVLGLLSLVIMAAAAAVLHPAGVQVDSPGDMASVLEPTVGRWASGLFALGLGAAAFSSLVGNGTIGGSMLASVFGGERDRLSSVRVKVCITLVMLLGGVVAVVFGGIPVQLIVTAQAATVLVVPLIGVVLIVLARHRERGDLRIRAAQLVLAGAGVCFLLLLALNYVRSLW